jgi:hypothetical protein
MNPAREPGFLSREIVDAIHEEQINAFGGLHGVRDENTLESAIMAAQNVYYYGGGDVYEVARRMLTISLRAQLIWMETRELVLRRLSCFWRDVVFRAVGCLNSKLTMP